MSVMPVLDIGPRLNSIMPEGGCSITNGFQFTGFGRCPQTGT